MMEDTRWKCPVCGLETQNAKEQDEHIQQTGHIIHRGIDDPGKETPPKPSDLEYEEHQGYTPGVSSGDLRSDVPDLDSKDRAESKSEEKKKRS